MNHTNKNQVFSDTVLRVLFYLPFLLVSVGFSNLENPLILGFEAKYLTAGLFFAAAVCWVSYAVHELFTGYKPEDLHWE